MKKTDFSLIKYSFQNNMTEIVKSEILMQAQTELHDMVREMLQSYTQSELAKATKVDQSTISKVKNNRINVRHDKGEKLRCFYVSWNEKKAAS